MRFARTAAVVVVTVLSLCLRAGAVPKTPTRTQQTEIDKLDKELLQHQIHTAVFPAAKVARKLYELVRIGWGDDAPETLRRANALAGALMQIGDYAGAVTMYKLVLAATEKAHGASSREAMYALMPLLGPYWAQNSLDELDPLFRRMLALSKQLDGEASTAYAGALLQYGTLLNQRAEYSSAQRYYEHALKIYEAVSTDELALLGPLQILASVYWQTNQRPKAIQLYDRAIAIATKATAPGAGPLAGNVQLLAGSLWGISSTYHYGGRDDLAAPLTKRVIDLYTAELARLEKSKPDDPQLPGMLGQLGFTYRQTGDLANADKLLSRSVELDEQRGTKFSAWMATLAEVKRALGKPKDALVLLEKAQLQLSAISAISANLYNTQIADVLRELGDYKRAESLLVAYQASLERTYGKRHMLYGMAQLSLAYVYMSSGRLAQAEAVLRESLETSERELALVLKTGTEADHAVYFARNGYQLDTALNFELLYAPTSGSAARLGLTTLLRRKGRVLDAAAANLATIRAKLSPEDKRLLDELASARATLAKLTVAGPAATGDADYAKEVATLEDQIQKLEVAVGKKSVAYRAVTQPIELAAVQRMIPNDARLVEVVNFQPGDPKAPYQAMPVLAPRRYAAFVVAAKGDPVLIDLGPAPAIEAAIETFRKAVADPKSTQVPALGRALYDLTMAKLTPALGGATNLLLAPDGALNVVPFSALVDDKGKFLLQTYTFTYLTSGRDLLRLGVKTKAQGGGVIFADPSFDATSPKAPANDPAGTRGRRSAELASLLWPPLPGTAQEADEVEKKMVGLTVFRGADATEGAVKAVHGPRVLHLATHGFFLPDEPPPPAKAGDARGGASSAPTTTYENPLLRSGLAFAGANNLASGTDDGILTAMEASGLDLWGTKLVVLSACETGVGKVTNGDGVYGLRRALVIAGAESLVMSLWQVDDLATRDLMAGYYARLGAGRGRSAALRDIQLELAARKEYAHPYYWASFLPAGDSSPLVTGARKGAR